MVIDGNGIAVANLKLFSDYCRSEEIRKYIYFRGYQESSHTGEEMHVWDGSVYKEYFGVAGYIGATVISMNS